MNWLQRINNAEQRGHFLREDIIDARNWPDCACGEQDPRIPRYMDGAPKDEILYRLGLSFSEMINMTNFQGCRGILEAIESRSTILLQRMSKNEETTETVISS